MPQKQQRGPIQVDVVHHMRHHSSLGRLGRAECDVNYGEEHMRSFRTLAGRNKAASLKVGVCMGNRLYGSSPFDSMGGYFL